MLSIMIADYIISSNDNRPLQSHQSIVLAGAFENGEEVTEVTADGRRNLSCLNSDHEEADTRIIFHTCVTDADFRRRRTNGRIIIETPDTDVLVLAIHHIPKLSNTTELWIKTGIVTPCGNKRRYIPVHDICKNIPPVLGQILPAVHSITGADTTSMFYSIGKKTVWNNIMKLGAHKFQYLKNFALQSTDEMTNVNLARKFVSNMYDPSGKYGRKHDNLTELRCAMSATVKDVAYLPPSEPAFLQHVRRAVHQTQIWLNAHVAVLKLESPVGHGWDISQDGLIRPVFFEGSTTTEMMRGLLCGSKTCNETCSCKQASMECCDLCSCDDSCPNQSTEMHESNPSLNDTENSGHHTET